MKPRGDDQDEADAPKEAAGPTVSVSFLTGLDPRQVMALEPPPLSPGETLGSRFTILRRIGDGGTGTVFAARDLLLAEDVALKVLHRSGVVTDDVSLRRLRDEVRAARRIAHPNVCRVHDLGEIDGRVFVVMELLPGVTLREPLRQGVGVGEALEMLRQLAAGLGAAHRAGVIHCDVKPENALLTGDGARPRVVLTDFGIARLIGPSSRAGPELPVEGTPAYMAPEQLVGGVVDERADVYALAVIACELLLRAHPFGVTASSTFLSLSHRVLTAPPLFPDGRPAGLDPDARAALVRALSRGLAREPEARHDGVEALVAALVAACGHAAGTRPPPHLPPAPDELDLRTPVRLTPQPRRASSLAKGVRRLCTIAHVLVEATPTLREHDEERATERIEAMLDVAEAALGDAGGTLVARVPHAVVAAFGARSSQGDEPQRAADAARAVVAAAGEDTLVRAGIDTGRLLVRIGPTGTLTVAGDALTRAAALAEEEGGHGGEVRVTDRAARHLARRFVLESAGSGSRLVARRPAARAEIRGLPLLGRERELNRLVETLAAAAPLGRPRGALLLGPPGVGKSRLRREVTAALVSRGFVPLVAGASPDDALEPYAVLRVLLRELLGLPDQPTAEEASAASRRALRRASDPDATADGTDHPLAAALARLVGPRADLSLASGRTIGLPGAPVLGAARAALTAAASRRPLLVVVEDAGWADDATLDLLEAIARGELEAPVALLAEGRSDLLTRRPRASDAFAVRIELGPLPPDRALELAQLCLGAAATPEAARAVAESAEGNPFHIEEMARDLVERGAAAGSVPSPTTVEEAIQARLDRLDSDARDLLRAAAVLGRTFRRVELEDLLLAGDGGVTEHLDRHLDELEERRILHALPPDAMCDDRYAISHALIREVAYRELAPATRRALHAAAARLLRAGRIDTGEGVERGPERVERLAELARHLEGADERGDALAAYRRAGELALGQGAPAEALRCLRRARALAGDRPPPELLVATGTAALEAGEVAESEAALDEAIAACGADRARVAARAFYARSALSKQRGRWDEAATYARRGLALVSDADEPVLAALLHGALGWVAGYIQGDVQTGLAECLLAVELLSGTPHLAELALAYSALGAAYMRAGRWRDQLRCNRKNLEIGEKLGSIELCARAHGNLGVNLQALGETAESITHSRTALALRQRMCATPGVGLARNNLAIALVDAGRLDEAELELIEAKRLSDLCGGLYYRYEVELSLSRIAARRGVLDQALAHAEAALAHATRDGGRVDEGIARKTIGAVLSMAGQHESAWEALDAAAAILEDADLGEAARVLAEQARAALRRGEPAGELVDEARRRLRSLGASLDEAHVGDTFWI